MKKPSETALNQTPLLTDSTIVSFQKNMQDMLVVMRTLLQAMRETITK